MTSYTAHALILRPGALGDTLLLAPALQSLGARCRVTVVGRQPGLSLLRRCGAQGIDFETGGWHRLFEEPVAAWRPEVRPSPQRVVAFLRDADGSVERNLERLFPTSRVAVFPGLPPKDARVHAAAYLAACLARSGMEIDPKACLQRAGETPVLDGGAPGSETSGIVLHPGSGGRRKNHPLSFWEQLMQAFLEGAPAEKARECVTLLFGPAEEALIEAFDEVVQQEEIRVVCCPSMDSLASLLGNARLYVGHDSGVTHLAAMLGTPTVALFRETDPRLWGPLGPRVRVISKHQADSGLVEATMRAAKQLGRTSLGG